MFSKLFLFFPKNQNSRLPISQIQFNIQDVLPSPNETSKFLKINIFTFLWTLRELSLINLKPMEGNRANNAIANANLQNFQQANVQGSASAPPPQPNPDQEDNQIKMINGSNCLHQTFFTWVYKLLSISQGEDITVESTPSLPTYLKAEHQFNLYVENKKELISMGLLSMLRKAFGGEFTFLILLCLLVQVFYLSYPVLIYFNVDYLQNNKQNISYGIMLFLLTMFSSFMYNYTYTNLKFRAKCLGVNISTHLNLIIFHKSLYYNIVASKKFKEHDIRGLSQIDTQNLMLVSRLYYFIFGITDFIVGFSLLYWFVGIAFLAGLIITILVSIITYFVSSYGVKVTEKAFQSRDQRLQSASQMLKIIRFIKLNAMEKFIFKKIQLKREEELNNFRSKGIIQIGLVFLYYLTAPLLLISTIVTYILINQTIDPAKVYTTMMIAVIFQVTAQQLPKTTSQLLSILRSIQRINEFLQAPDIDMRNYKHNQDKQNGQFAIVINNGDFFIRKDEGDRREQNQHQVEDNQSNPQGNSNKKKGSNQIANEAGGMNANNNIDNSIANIVGTSSRRDLSNESQLNNQIPILKGINLKIAKGKLYLIYGDIGSGKSMLLLSILNQMNKRSHSQVQVNGKIAYVSQRPWIFEGTIQDNICFTFEKQQELFRDALKYSCLEDDIKEMPKRQETQIGQNGINLSGGQKFRVDLARSLYSQSDIYLYDDVLSAVDIHVGSFIFNQTIKKYLKDKTVILATHAIKFAEKADYIILMKNGEIIACDTYQEIREYPQFEQIQAQIIERQKMGKTLKQVAVQQPSSRKLQESIYTSKHIVQVQNPSLIEELILPQDQQKDEVDIKIYNEYIRLNGGYLCFLLVIVLCFLVYSILQTASSIILSNWSQNSQGSRTPLYIFIAMAIFANLFIFIEAIILLLSGVKQGREVHSSIIKGLLYASLSNFFNRVPLGRIINRLGKDLKQLDQAIASTLSSTLIAFFRILSAIFICIFTSTPFALIPVAVVVVIFLKIRKFYLKCQTKIIRLQKITNSPLLISFTNGLVGGTSIRCYKSTDRYLQKHIQLVNNYKQVLFSHYAISCWLILTLVFLGYLVNTFCIGYSMFGPSGNPAYMGLLLTYILNLNDELFQFVLDEADFQAKLVSLERLYNFMTLAPEKGYNEYCQNWDPQEQQLYETIQHGSIEFKNASVKYRSGLPKVLKNVSIRINAGQKVGIIGRTGSGKTTILNTLIRITELSSGQILIDNKKLNDIPLKSLRAEITVIDQQPVLINSTFKENLDVFNQYSDQELLKIIQECNIAEIVEKRGGLYGQISNDSLSAGEKQLICICRALLKNSRIVLIDEATANIDLKNDAIIQEVLTSKFVGKTLLTIAHRLSTIKKSDKILVMQRGEALQFGTPNELLEKKGMYYKMINKYKDHEDEQFDQFQQ